MSALSIGIVLAIIVGDSVVRWSERNAGRPYTSEEVRVTMTEIVTQMTEIEAGQASAERDNPALKRNKKSEERRAARTRDH